MNRLKLFSIAALALALLAEAAPAQQPARPAAVPSQDSAGRATALQREGAYWVEEETGKIPAGTRLSIVSSQGAIELRGAAQGEITYRVRKRVAAPSEAAARRILAAHPLVAQRRGEIVYVGVSGAGRGFQTDYFVVAPRNTVRADLETQAGGVLADGVEGTLQVQTAGGAIEVDHIGGDVDLMTGGGPVSMGTIGGAVRAQTAGGNVRLDSAGGNVFIVTQAGGIEIGTAARQVQARTAGGEIRIGQAGGDVIAESAGGHIQIGEAAGVSAMTLGGTIRVDKARAAVRAETAIGSIHLLNCLGPVQAESAAGSITARIAANRASWAASALQTTAGDITVYLPANLALTIQAAIAMASRTQGIHSDFPLTLRGGAAFGPRVVLGEGAINGGGPQLLLRTTAGSIEIRSQK